MAEIEQPWLSPREMPLPGARIEVEAPYIDVNGHVYNKFGIVLDCDRILSYETHVSGYRGCTAKVRPEGDLLVGRGPKWGFFLQHRNINTRWRYAPLPQAPFAELIEPTKKENNSMSSMNLYGGSLRVKGGYVPVVYNGNVDDGPNDSEIFWQGDLTKPFTDDFTAVPRVFGSATAASLAQKVIEQFYADGIEAAAKKVAKE